MPEKDKFRVLVVDDEPTIPPAIGRLVNVSGYESEGAADGAEALEKIAPDPLRYDLVFLDINMPGMDGIEALPKIKELDPDLPVVILTGDTNVDNAVRLMKSGAVDYVSKPIARQRITEILQQTIPYSMDVGCPTVLKFGGSAWLYKRHHPKSKNLRKLVRFCIDRPKGSLIVTTGAGLFGYDLKEFLTWYRDMGTVEQDFSDAMELCFELNVKNLDSMFGESADRISPEDFHAITEQFLQDRIALMPLAPAHILRKYKISKKDSDTSSVAIADFYGARRLIIVKGTDGAYYFDPNKGRKQGEESWQQTQRTNGLLRTLYVDQVLDGTISTVGDYDGAPDHFFEKTAALYFRDRATHLQEILVVHIAPESMYVGGRDKVHVVDPSIPYVHLEQRLAQAWQGEALTRIVRR